MRDLSGFESKRDDATHGETDPSGDGLTAPHAIKVLIIEDSDTDFGLIRRMLQLMETFRAEVSHARDLAAARSMAGDQHFDVALVDFYLGIDTGAQAIHELGGRLGSTAVILLTGMPGHEILQSALKAGAIHCLDKNQLNPVLLETTVRSALHTHELEAKLHEMIIDLELANRAKTEFFARMGNDLKTPLNAILGFTDMITRQSLGASVPDPYIACAERIRVGGTHLLEVLNNLIYHSASQGSFSGGQFESAKINDLVQRAVGLIDMLARTRRHTVEVSLPEDSPVVNCRPAVLTQAILNVLSNAVKYTPPCGHVVVSVISTSRHNEIWVRDNGIGMSREDVDVALSPFGRVELPAQLAQDGTGIGLPIVRDIIATHGGQLEIDSMPGKGTTIVLRLPARQEDRNAA